VVQRRVTVLRRLGNQKGQNPRLKNSPRISLMFKNPRGSSHHGAQDVTGARPGSRPRAFIAAFACFVVPLGFMWLLPIFLDNSGDVIVTRRIGEEARRGHLATVNFFLMVAMLILSQTLGWAILLRAGIWKYVSAVFTIIFCVLSIFVLTGLGIFVIAIGQTLINQ